MTLKKEEVLVAAAVVTKDQISVVTKAAVAVAVAAVIIQGEGQILVATKDPILAETKDQISVVTSRLEGIHKDPTLVATKALILVATKDLMLAETNQILQDIQGDKITKDPFLAAGTKDQIPVVTNGQGLIQTFATILLQFSNFITDLMTGIIFSEEFLTNLSIGILG
jgi:hypothetical protein